MKLLVLATKVLPILLAFISFINIVLSFAIGNTYCLNYIASLSVLPVVYLYIVSYVIKLCNYYRMFLHYAVITNLINIYDYYVGFDCSDMTYFMMLMGLTVVTMLIIIKLKFF